MNKPRHHAFLRRTIAWLGIILSTVTGAAAPAGWQRLAPLPVGNGGFVAAAIDGEIVVAGGTTWQGDTKSWLDAIWAFDPKRNAWRAAGRLPAPIAYGVAGQDDNTVWFAGGSDGTIVHRSLWKMERGLSPVRVAPLERGSVFAAGARIGSTLYVVGGTDDPAKLDRITNTFLAVDLRSGAITRLADYPEAGLTTGTAAAAGDRLYVFGGARWDATKQTVANHATAHVYSPAEKRWTALPRLPHPGRGFTAITLDERHILVVGGYRNDEVEFVADALLFDLKTNAYVRTTPLPYAAMVNLVKHGDWLYCLGGEDRKKNRTAAAYRIRWRELLAAAR